MNLKHFTLTCKLCGSEGVAEMKIYKDIHRRWIATLLFSCSSPTCANQEGEHAEMSRTSRRNKICPPPTPSTLKLCEQAIDSLKEALVADFMKEYYQDAPNRLAQTTPEPTTPSL